MDMLSHMCFTDAGQILHVVFVKNDKFIAYNYKFMKKKLI